MKRTRWASVSGVGRAIMRALRAAALVALAVAGLRLAGEAGEYALQGHRLDSGAACAEFDALFAALRANAAAPLPVCARQSGPAEAAPGQRLHFVTLAADNARPTFGNTGHAWASWLALEPLAPGRYRVTAFAPVGIGPKRDQNLLSRGWRSFYARTLRPALPEGARVPVDHLVAATSESLEFFDDGVRALGASETLIVDLAEPESVRAAAERLAVAKMAEAFTLQVDEAAFARAWAVKDRFAVGRYMVLTRDCVTFLREVADELGLYTPPRIFSWFPAESVAGLRSANWRR